MIISKVISTIIQNGINVIKVLRLGNSDVQTGYNVQPFGIDGNIPSGYRAIFADTGNRGDKIIIGVINKNALAEVGELRFHSEKSNGSESFAIYLKSDGTCEIGGNANFAVKYNELKQQLDKTNEVITAITNSLQNWSPIPSDGGAALKTFFSSQIASKSLGDYSQAKNDKIKTL